MHPPGRAVSHQPGETPGTIGELGAFAADRTRQQWGVAPYSPEVSGAGAATRFGDDEDNQ
jgi:hypothetical protein